LAEQAPTEPDAIEIRKSEGAYLTIFRDGSAKAGFGALLHCAEMPAETFDFLQLSQVDLNEQMLIANEKRDASAPYIAVGFSRDSAARLYHFDNRALINALFEHAERHAKIINAKATC